MKRLRENKWYKKYNLAKIYFEHYGNLDVPSNFRTSNGIDYDPKGVNLRMWLYTQKRAFYNIGSTIINEEKIKLLKNIGYSFEYLSNEEKWFEKYKLAKNYFKHYGNTEIPMRFKTKNGIDYDDDGVLLGSWVNLQRQVYIGNVKGHLSDEQIKLLKEINMRFDVKNSDIEWMRKYELAKEYYLKNGHLEIPISYVTEDKTKLGIWIYHQRQSFANRGFGKITEEQIKLLNEIGMRFETKDIEEEWLKKYELSKNYYKKYHNLKIKNDFKTINGIDYDEKGISLGMWLRNQKTAYSGTGRFKLTDKQIKMLESIGINWYTNKTDDRLQLEEIKEDNRIKKQKEILHRTYTLLNKYKESTLPSKEKLNNEFIRQLRR